MESLDEGSKTSKGFIKHVFNFDEDSKCEISNIIQYSLLAIIPIVILNKCMQKYVPEADDEKGSLEILAEIIIQIIVMFIGLLLIDRIITFIPTYCGMKYPEHSILYVILGTLMVIMSLQTKLGEKVNILVERVIELWEGKKDNKKKNKTSGNVKVSQPISQQGVVNNQTAMNQTVYTDGTSINQLPTNMDVNQNTLSPQQLPNYNNMYRNDSNPLVNAATPGQSEGFNSMYNEPMAANAALGGGAFGSW
jgi:hypothetical protein